jgi:putative ABC transport system ATP-binding protein
MTGAVLYAERLTRVFGSGATAVRALSDVSLELEPGELVIVRGPSGSGKTTLLNLLGGLDAPTSGRVWLDGKEFTGAGEAQLVEARRRRLGFVFQSFALLPMLSAAENIELPLRLIDTPKVDRVERVRVLLDAVGLGAHRNQRPAELSGGQQQRVGLARALANRPSVLIADEPTGQLDSMTAASMVGLIAGLVRDYGVAAIMSTHDPKMAASADRVIELRDGVLA